MRQEIPIQKNLLCLLCPLPIIHPRDPKNIFKHSHMFAKRLHIPLHTKKTVRRKRTVSLYLFFFLGGLFSLWFCARAWMINRSLTLTFIPEGTSAVILLSPTQETWPKILEDFGDIPLLSHRSLTLSDIAPYLEGPFSFFFLKNGET